MTVFHRGGSEPGELPEVEHLHGDRKDGLGGLDFWSITSPYHISDGGVVVWDDEHEIRFLEADEDKKQAGHLYEALVGLIKEYQ